ncbi:hypothetical protein BGW42_008265 [Actinomortierella wolfii]|nr:hypothetical protein BGW42_008265 [Actinomortierella wolfii]
MSALRLASRNLAAMARPQGVRYFQSSRTVLGPIIEANDQTFLQEIKREGPIIVDFHAEWCGPCKFMDPILKDKANNSNITLIKVNIDECPQITAKHEIRGVPTIFAYENGKSVAQSVGALNKGQLDAFVEKSFGNK